MLGFQTTGFTTHPEADSLTTLSHFHTLTSLQHPNLAPLLSLSRGRHERLTLIQLCSDTPLSSILSSTAHNLGFVTSLARQIVSALVALHASGFTSGANLSTSSVFLANEIDSPHFLLAGYALPHITERGDLVPFPVIDPDTLPPEASEGRGGCDVWALGLLLASVWTGKEWVFDSTITPLESEIGPLLESMDNELLAHFVAHTLVPDPDSRPTPEQLISHPLISTLQDTTRSAGAANSTVWAPKPVARSLLLPDPKTLDAGGGSGSPSSSSAASILSHFPPKQLLFFWRLMGNQEHPDSSSTPAATGPGFASASGSAAAPPAKNPPILAIPSIIRLNTTATTASTTSSTTTITTPPPTPVFVPLDDLASRLQESLAKARGQAGPELTFSSPYLAAESWVLPTPSGSMTDPTNIPLAIRESDFDYQLMRILVFDRILRDMPLSRMELEKEAAKDIPPLLRGRIWAALLGIGVSQDIQAAYHSVDKVGPGEIDHQISVDVPRCHQYDDWLASSVGQAKLTRVLKRWVAGQETMVYWQGLDSVAAPFVRLLFDDEALAYGCLDAVVSTFLSEFFVEDNSAVMQRTLHAFSQLLAFTFPRVAAHTIDLGFGPELYAIPWFLTMFAHVFPIDSLVILWDSLLIGPPALKFFVALGLVEQMQSLLEGADFGVCVVAFSELPSVDFEQCITAAKRLYSQAPKSIRDKLIFDSSPNPVLDTVIRTEWSPRLAAGELIALLRQSPPAAVCIDVRARDDIKAHGALDTAIIAPFADLEANPDRLHAIIPDENDGETQNLRLVYAVLGPPDHANEVAKALVLSGLPRVVIVEGGWHAVLSILKPSPSSST